MKTSLIIFAVFFCSLVASGGASALAVSSTDLWQDALDLNSSSPQPGDGGTWLTGIFDGQQGGYGVETGNFIFRSTSSPNQTVEWSTASTVTVRSINFVTYHDFEINNITNRGIQSLTLSYQQGSDWVSFFEWEYTNPNNDLHYGGGPSYQFDPDPNDMTRSYLELTANLDSPITAQNFQGVFERYGSMGSRIVELDAYSTPQVIPLPASLLLLASGLLGLVTVSKVRVH